MAIKPGLRVRQSQRLALTPALRLSVRVLSLSSADLRDLVNREMEQNPLLQHTGTPLGGTGEAYRYALDTTPLRDTLAQSLCRQISLSRKPEATRNLAQYMACNLDERGYLAISAVEMLDYFDTTARQMAAALELLQASGPTGVGARDLRECLGLQLRAAGQSPDEIEDICDHLDLFSRNDWQALKRKTGRSQQTLRRLLGVLQTLDPAPGQSFDDDQNAPLAPDIVVKSRPDGGYTAELANGISPALEIDQDVFQTTLAKDPASKAYLLARRAAATDLIRAIDGRFRTLSRIVNEIVLEQARFFDDGQAFLKPLRRLDLAQTLGIHPSTVTRALANKTLECRFGVFSLDFFFPSALATDDPASPVSSHAIQHSIAGLVAQESPDKILSDARIATLLHESGVDIARRTVAKYRQCLKIPSSVQRRRSKQVL